MLWGTQMIDENHYFYARIGSGRKRHVVRTGAKTETAICGMGGRLEPPGDVLLVCSACLKKLARMRSE